MQFKVPDMSCGHCTRAIETAVKAADGGARIACDLEARVVTVDSALSADALSGILKSEGYESELVA